MSKILIVDDEDTTRKNMEHLLSKQGWNISTASNAAEAIDLIKENEFDVVVTEMRMEDEESGPSVLQVAKRKDKFTEVIIITACPSVKNAADAMERDAFTYLNKDDDKSYEVLCSKVEEALKRRQREITDGTQWALVMNEIARRRYTTLSELSSALRVVPSKLRGIVNELLAQGKIFRKYKGKLELYYLK